MHCTTLAGQGISNQSNRPMRTIQACVLFPFKTDQLNEHLQDLSSERSINTCYYSPLLPLLCVQLIGGGLVPLSHAQCCRPCLPKVLPEDPSRGKGPNDTALAVVSLGCHASTSAGAACVPANQNMPASSYVAEDHFREICKVV